MLICENPINYESIIDVYIRKYINAKDLTNLAKVLTNCGTQRDKGRGSYRGLRPRIKLKRI
jgi:hypothetical protein